MWKLQWFLFLEDEVMRRLRVGAVARLGRPRRRPVPTALLDHRGFPAVFAARARWRTVVRLAARPEFILFLVQY